MESNPDCFPHIYVLHVVVFPFLRNYLELHNYWYGLQGPLGVGVEAVN